MGIKTNKGRESQAYIGTFRYDSYDDMFQLEDLRAMVKHMNRDLRAAKMDYQFYVKCQGRGSRLGNPKYNMCLPLSVADKMDAYIYRR
jgi:hypothetical protein